MAVEVAFAVLALMVQEPSLEERVAEIVKVRYADATEEHRAHVAQRMCAILREAPDPGTIDRFVKQLDPSFQYSRAFVQPYDFRAQGDASSPPLPLPLKTRQLDLELAWVETYYRDGLAARLLDDRARESITRQLDGLISQVRNVVTSKVVGPFAAQAIDEKLGNMRHHLFGTFDTAVSANFPRLLSTTEVDALLDKVRKLSEGMGEIQVDESLQSLRGGVGERYDERAKARLQQSNEIENAISALSLPLYDIFDLWDPERARIRKELERLRSEVQAWRSETYDDMKRRARAVGPDAAERPKVTVVPLSDPSPALATTVEKTPIESSPKGPGATPTPQRRGPWIWIAVAILLGGAAVGWRWFRTSKSTV